MESYLESLPLVSVVMPAYNCAPYIGAAINSVLAQSYKNIEVIVVDDGSSDGTPQVVAAYGSPVRLVQQGNAGAAAARNRAMAECRGELICFLDSDDVWAPSKIEWQVAQMLAYPDIDLVFSRFKRFDGEPPSDLFASNAGSPSVEWLGWYYQPLLLDSAIWIVTAMIRRGLWDKIGGFDETLPIGEDYDFWLRASRHTRVVKLSDTLAGYRNNPDSLTKKIRDRNYEFEVLKAYVDRFGVTDPGGAAADIGPVSQRMAHLCFGHAYGHFWQGNVSRARQECAKAWAYGDHSPKNIGYWLASIVRSWFVRT